MTFLTFYNSLFSLAQALMLQYDMESAYIFVLIRAKQAAAKVELK